MTVEAQLPRRRFPLTGWDAVRLPVLLALGLLLGLYGAFLLPTGPRVGSHLLSVGAALAVVANPVAVRVGLRAVPRFGGLVLLLGWFAVALTLTFKPGNGSIVLPGSGDLAVPALVYVVGGLVAGGAAAMVRTRR